MTELIPEREKYLRELLEEFVDDEPCWLDHHGYCQTHIDFSGEVCRVVRARAALGLPAINPRFD